MSTMKAKFRPGVKKLPAPQTWCVDVYEHERGSVWKIISNSPVRKKREYANKANVEFAKSGSDDKKTKS